jgi:trypsin
MKLGQFLLATSFIVSTSPAFALSNKIHMDIVGGTDAVVGEFPFIVSLQQNGFGHFCGGSLIGKHWVLTAAHCVSDPIDKVVIGIRDQNDTSNTESLSVKQVIRHPQYNETTTDYDFALLELSADSSYTPISLNTTEIDIPLTGAPVLATVAGWGTTAENGYSLPAILQKVDVPLVSNDVCNADYKGVITDRMICAGLTEGGKDSCQGDSGGPLMAESADHQRRLIGVVSWGEGCARAGLPGIYSKVNAAAAWIAQNAH